MKTTFFREVTLYRYRYILGYIMFGILLLALLLLAINQAPRGLSIAEMNTAVTSVNINIFDPSSKNVIDAPYHLLQKASIQLLGLSPVALKLPSIVIGAITGVAIILMLQKWFRKNVAIITALIIVTSVGFLTLARTGTPDIMPTFWTVLLLLGATHILHSERYRFLWKLYCFSIVALLAYSPFGIYPLLAMIVAGMFHPHVRHRLKQGKWWQHGLVIALVLIILAPLAVSIVKMPNVGLVLFGLQTDVIDWKALPLTGLKLLSDTFNFTNNTVGLYITPLFGIATTILIVLGILKLLTARYSARSYMLLIWIILLIPVLIIRPDRLLLIIVPMALFLAIGVETLIRQWYDLFPRNPYARIAALIPLSILVVSTVGINMERYFYGYHYSPPQHVYFNELPAVRERLQSEKNASRPYTIIVPSNQIAFYDVLRREYPSIRITDSQQYQKGAVIVLASAGELNAVFGLPSRVVTTDLSHDPVLMRFYDGS